MSDASALSKSKFWSMMFAIFFGNFLAVLSTNMVTVALPVLMEQFDVTLTSIQWVMTGFLLATGTVAPAIGFLGNRFSTKRLYLFALMGFVVSSCLCALAWNETSLILFRVLQGSFSGIIMPTTMSIVYQVIPKSQQAFGISIWSLSAMLAPAIGPTLAGWLTHVFNWQWLFWINIPIGLAAIWAVIKFIPMYKVGGQTGFDKLGFLMVVSGSILLLYAIGNTQTWGWLGWKTIGCIVIGGAIIGLFIFRSLRQKYPLLQFKVFQSRQFAYSMILVSIITISLYSGSLITPLFLQNVQKASTLTAGLIMLPASLLMAMVIPFTGRWYVRFGPARMISLGLALIAISSFAMSHLHVNTSHAAIIFWLIFRNIGIALANTPSVNAGMSAIRREWTGYGSSINSWLRQGLAALSISMFSSILVSRTMHHIEVLSQGGAVDQATVQLEAYAQGINDVNFIGFLLALIAIPIALQLKGYAAQTDKGAAVQVSSSSSADRAAKPEQHKE
ncbi:MDR family MFS transporter [Paenibacillus marinisediminis]